MYDQLLYHPPPLARPPFLDRWVVRQRTLRDWVLSTWAGSYSNHCRHSQVAPRPQLKWLWHEAVTNEWALHGDWSNSERRKELGCTELGHRASLPRILSVPWLRDKSHFQEHREPFHILLPPLPQSCLVLGSSTCHGEQPFKRQWRRSCRSILYWN